MYFEILIYYYYFFNDKGLLLYARGWPCCMSIAPILSPKASVSITNSEAKSGSANAGGVVMAILSY